MAQNFESFSLHNGTVTVVLVEVGKFDIAMAADTMSVMMQFFIVDMLKKQVLLPKGGFPDDAGLQKLAHGTIDRGAGNLQMIFSADLDDLFCREMAVCVDHRVQNLQTAGAHTQAGLV